MDRHMLEINSDHGVVHIPVYVMESSSQDADAVHFSCGLSMEPWMYGKYLEGLYEGLEGRVSIFASAIAGHKISSGIGKYPNSSRAANTRLFHKVIEEIGEGNDVNIAHSAGPITMPEDNIDAPEKYILINPMAKVDYGAPGFIGRCLFAYGSLWGEVRPADYLNQMLDSEHAAAKNFMRNIGNNIRLTDEFKRLATDEIFPSVDSKALLLYTGNCNHSDKLFMYTGGFVSRLEDRFAEISFRKIEGKDHNDVLCNSQYISHSVDFLNR